MRATNIWRRFRDLVAEPAEEIVVIVSLAGGWATATTLAGGTLRLRCALDVQPGDKVFAAAGEARAKAPNLPAYEIEI